MRFEFLDYPETHARFPLLTRTLTSLSDGPGRDDSSFEFGLARTLDGIAAGFATAE